MRAKMAGPMEPSDEWKICALCRHLETIGQGREFERIADTEYLVFRCRKLGVTTREDYLMAPVSETLDRPERPVCPYWEPWDSPP